VARNDKHVHQLKAESKINAEINEGLSKANTNCEALINKIKDSLIASTEQCKNSLDAAVQDSQRKDLRIKELDELRSTDVQGIKDEHIAAMQQIEECHKKDKENAQKEGAEALKAEFERGRRTGEQDEQVNSNNQRSTLVEGA